MNKAQLIQALRTLASLQQIEGASTHKIRTLMNTADALAQSTLPFETILAHPETLSGVGRATAQLLHTLTTDGLTGALVELNIATPPSVVDLTRVAGIGPKTALKIYQELGVTTLAALEQALRDGRLQTVTGIGAKSLPRMRRDIPVLRQAEVLIPIAKAWPLACAVKQALAALPGVLRCEITGDARRLTVLSPRVEWLVATDHKRALEQWLNQFPHTLHSTHSDLTLHDGTRAYPARIHFATPDAFATRWLATTGDATHQAVIGEFLAQQNCRWTEQGIVDAQNFPMHFATEEAIYAFLGLPYYPPEIREEAGLRYAPGLLVQTTDIRGDLHVHSTWSDGSQSIHDIVQSAERLGYAYVAITDHSQSLTIAGGLTVEDLRRQHTEIEQVRANARIAVLHGIEVDILADGRLDLPYDVLQALDVVVASVHSAMNQSKAQMTERLLRAIAHPAVDIIGHMSGRKIGLRAGYELDFGKVLAAAIEHGVTIELNANPNRLDIAEQWLHIAVEAGARIAIDTDAHHPPEFANMAYGIGMAKRGGVPTAQVLNALDVGALRHLLHGRRHEHS